MFCLFCNHQYRILFLFQTKVLAYSSALMMTSRLLVPARIAFAIALAPYVEKARNGTLKFEFDMEPQLSTKASKD